MTPIDERDIAIKFENVTKTYSIQRRASPRMGAWVVNKLLEHLRREPFHALKDVSFTVKKGEMVGFLGANGAGKSTALKLAAGITLPTSGRVLTRGRIASLLELGVGFHGELSGIENIFYNASIMGLTRAETLKRLESIIEFSGLRKFLFEPVKHYSSGMYARLAVSVALHLDADIILVDEILAVGDAEFQQRGMLKILDMHESGITILLVTHEVTTARDLCDRLIWIDHGELQMAGEPEALYASYMRRMNELSAPEGHFLSPRTPLPAKPVGVLGAARAIANQQPVRTIKTGDPVTFEFDIKDLSQPASVAFQARWEDGRTLFEDRSPLLEPGATKVVYEIPAMPLLEAKIHISAALITPDGVVQSQALNAIELEILSPGVAFTNWVTDLPTNWSVEELSET